jgi:hypothetical protein
MIQTKFRESRHYQLLLAIVLCFAVVSGSIISSISRGVEARNWVAFGPKGIVLCLTDHAAPDFSSDRHDSSTHSTDCCVLCSVPGVPKLFESAQLPYLIAFPPISVVRFIIAPHYSEPNIALSDGVFPHDIPARAPPLSAA